MSGHDNDRADTDREVIKFDDDPSKFKAVVATVRNGTMISDLRAVRPRRRRQRPHKLRIDTSTTDKKLGLYEPDIESFVSGCITGVSIATESSSAQRRSRMSRQRSLPLLSYLATTHLAAAEKKRKKEQIESQHLIAAEEARKALLLNPIIPALDHGEGGGSMVGKINSIGIQKSTAKDDSRDNPQSVSEAPMVTIKTEESSHILMPPLLTSFLNQLQ